MFKLSVPWAFPVAIRILVVLLYSNLSAIISVLLSIKALPPLSAFKSFPLSKDFISGVSNIISSPILMFIEIKEKIIKKLIIFFYFSFNLTIPIRLINIKIINGNHTERIIGILPFSPRRPEK